LRAAAIPERADRCADRLQPITDCDRRGSDLPNALRQLTGQAGIVKQLVSKLLKTLERVPIGDHRKTVASLITLIFAGQKRASRFINSADLYAEALLILIPLSCSFIAKSVQYKATVHLSPTQMRRARQ